MGVGGTVASLDKLTKDFAFVCDNISIHCYIFIPPQLLKQFRVNRLDHDLNIFTQWYSEMLQGRNGKETVCWGTQPGKWD